MTFDGTVNVNFNEVHDGIANGPAPLTTGRHNGQLNGLHLDPGPEPIAVCGIGLRLPGGIRTGDDFWDVLYNGRDLRGPIPADRFNIDAFDDSLGKTGAIKTRYGYFLDEDLGVLDTSFFHISESELKKTDPQQRKVLEVARECFENAGEINWRAKPIGVYVGTFGDDWLQSLTRENQFKGGYNFTADLMIANKISYEFDLQGPSHELMQVMVQFGDQNRLQRKSGLPTRGMRGSS
ncbi:hypothetical protein QQS21_006763 [Conoideocrella luteorostrata]|uniref:Ketosynthase family 3 (KS3) domain-containing protein n=1 Tax=Conoideocrella luteorostrata TaxID=1105319 RepID=A0AAJ0CM00_9HYPO|nr:hypothetical protein QQS21_006763 [Conoideocrella luteorostrata]